MKRLPLLLFALLAGCQSSPTCAPPAPLIAERASWHADTYLQLKLGNPTGANGRDPDNLLLKKLHFALSYNASRGTPNWVSWVVVPADLGDAPRRPDFVEDDTLPVGVRRVSPAVYADGGFDLGHVCPHADRGATKEASYSTFVMTNVMPQAPKLNRGPWEQFEAYTRRHVEGGGGAIVMAGPVGVGGVGAKGAADKINGVTVPAKCWKIVFFIDPGAHMSRGPVCVLMPNRQDVGADWKAYQVTQGELEQAVGFEFGPGD